MSIRTLVRNAKEKPLRAARTRSAAAVVVVPAIALSIMVIAAIAFRFGGSAAAGEQSATANDAAPVSLAGRWLGTYGHGGFSDEHDCGRDGCQLAYDIVACQDGWCGIALKDDKSCGDVSLRLSSDPQSGKLGFNGKLEVTKGAAPYFVQAWSSGKEESTGPQLHLVGSTEPELLLFRRSYPFEAHLVRNGEARCPLPKATS